MLDHITPLILTYNEAPNLGRTLACLTWARRIVVVDSFSTDETLELARAYPQVEVFQRRFDTHAQQWNAGLGWVTSTWVLSLDADYQVTAALRSEMAALPVDGPLQGYWIPFHYCVFGKPLRGTLLPPRLALFRRERGHYWDDGHTQRLRCDGPTGRLHHCLLHDDRKSLGRWLWAQDRYVQLEVKKLRSTPWADLSWGDRLRRQKVLAPGVVLIYCLVIRGGIFDGWRGWYYALQRLLAEVLLALRLIEEDFAAMGDSGVGSGAK